MKAIFTYLTEKLKTKNVKSQVVIINLHSEEMCLSKDNLLQH